MTAIRRALISVSDKTGIEEFARALHTRNVEILSTGGTAKLLTGAGIPVIEVADHTGFPEIMDGRVKTLHPGIHGGLLGRRGIDDAVMAEHGIAPIDLLAVNLYPFGKERSIENIDVGGPALLRAAAKNHADVVVLVDSADYPAVLEAMDAGEVPMPLRRRLASKAFTHTAAYDGMIGGWLRAADGEVGEFPATLGLTFDKVCDLRYGENPHQRAAFYIDELTVEAGIATMEQVQGKDLSFNNIADADTAIECVRSFESPACVIVKHANPCGVATGESLSAAYERAHHTDPTAAFGGIIAFNRKLDAATAARVVERQFVEVVVAPAADDDARKALAARENVRLLVCGALDGTRIDAYDFKRVNSGLLVQDRDRAELDPTKLEIVSAREPTSTELQDMLFAWTVSRFVKSNAIVFCRDGATVGIGAGQMSRVTSARLAALKAADAGIEVKGAVMASDAFFPFRDGVDEAAAAGVTAVIQPGGSKRDAEVIAAADSHGMAMAFTGIRHFRH